MLYKGIPKGGRFIVHAVQIRIKHATDLWDVRLSSFLGCGYRRWALPHLNEMLTNTQYTQLSIYKAARKHHNTMVNIARQWLMPTVGQHYKKSTTCFIHAGVRDKHQGVWDRFASYTRVYETSAEGPRTIYLSPGIRQLLVTSQWASDVTIDRLN